MHWFFTGVTPNSHVYDESQDARHRISGKSENTSFPTEDHPPACTQEVGVWASAGGRHILSEILKNYCPSVQPKLSPDI